jgi:hypothetical protein
MGFERYNLLNRRSALSIILPHTRTWKYSGFKSLYKFSRVSRNEVYHVHGFTLDDVNCADAKGAFPPSHFSYKLADKRAHIVASQFYKCHTFVSCLSVRSLLQTKLVCYKLTKATLNASLSSSLLQKCDGGNAS